MVSTVVVCVCSAVICVCAVVILVESDPIPNTVNVLSVKVGVDHVTGATHPPGKCM